jgi:hypothetical protein
MALSVGCRDREQRAYGTTRPAENEPHMSRPPTEELSEPKGADQRAPKDSSPRGAMAFSDMKMKLAEAKCERAVRCQQIGKGKEWGSKDACIGATRNEEFPGLSAAQDCPKGVDASDVEKCAADIKGSSCDEELAQFCKSFLCVGAAEK